MKYDSTIRSNDGNTTITNMVKITVTSSSNKKLNIDVNHLVFNDKKYYDKPSFLNLQEVNAMLAFDSEFDGTTAADIMNRFSLLGVCLAIDQIKRSPLHATVMRNVLTIGVKGHYTVFDYWSSQDRVLNRYDNCYLVLKKVQLLKNDTFFTDISSQHVQRKVLEDMGRWQFVPMNSKERVITEHPYISVGHLHEYANFDSQFINYPTMSTPAIVARDVHHVERIVNNGLPVEFYFNVCQ